MTFYVQYCFLGSCFSTALFYKAFFFSEVTTVTAQLNKTNRGPPRFLQANVEELYMGTRFSAKTLSYETSSPRKCQTGLCLQGALSAMWTHICRPTRSLQEVPDSVYATHTHTYTHSHHIHIYVKGYICMYVHINILNSCPYSPI